MNTSSQGGKKKLVFHPLTPARWDDFALLFGERGACGGCWCMLWRLTRKEFEAQKGEANRKAMRLLVASGTMPGILAYAGKEAVGWCAVAPREDYPALGRSRVLKPIDARPVWSIACLFVKKDQRMQGISVALLRAVIAHVRKQGGSCVEGYPVEPHKPHMPDVFAWTGLPGAFVQAGFSECARGSGTRPIMRYEIKRSATRKRN